MKFQIIQDKTHMMSLCVASSLMENIGEVFLIRICRREKMLMEEIST